MAYYATIVKWPVCQDNLGKVVPQCQTTLGFTVAKDDGGSSGDKWDSETCAGHVHRALVKSPSLAYHFYRLDAIRIIQPTVSKH